MPLDGDESGRSLWWVFLDKIHVEAGSGCLVHQGVHRSSTWPEDGVEEDEYPFAHWWCTARLDPARATSRKLAVGHDERRGLGPEEARRGWTV